jgi:hypothetical protein
MKDLNSQVVPSITAVLKKISDDKTLTLFNIIAGVDGDKNIPLKELGLTTKQYHTRISGLLDAGLIKRHKGKYFLTLLGKIVYDTQMTIGKTLTYHWKLKGIESIEASNNPEWELAQLISALIDNRQIKNILMKSIHVPPTESSSTISATTTPRKE